jgi:hypothetical protein
MLAVAALREAHVDRIAFNHANTRRLMCTTLFHNVFEESTPRSIDDSSVIQPGGVMGYVRRMCLQNDFDGVTRSFLYV